MLAEPLHSPIRCTPLPAVAGREVHRINTPVPIAAVLDTKENLIFVQFRIQADIAIA